MPADHVRRTLGPHNWPRVALAPALVAAVVAVDRVVEARQPSLAVHGVLDEIGHLATAGVPLAVGLRAAPPIGRPRPALVTVALASAVLFDVDHVPAVLRWEGLTAGTPRPYPRTRSPRWRCSPPPRACCPGGHGRTPSPPWRAWPCTSSATWPPHPSLCGGRCPGRIPRPPHSGYLALMATLAVLDASAAARRPVVIDLRDPAPAPAQQRAEGPTGVPR